MEMNAIREFLGIEQNQMLMWVSFVPLEMYEGETL